MADINYGSIATAIGLAKLSNAALFNKPINITQIKLGDSNGIEYTPDGSELDLKNVVYTGLPNSIAPDPKNPDQFASMELVVPSDTESFYVREMGIYDGDGDLIYIAAIAPRFKPQASAQSVDMSFEIMVKVLNADNIVIKVDTSKTVATQNFVNVEVQKHKEDPDAHPQYLKAEDLPDFDEQLQGHKDDPDAHPQYLLKSTVKPVLLWENDSTSVNPTTITLLETIKNYEEVILECQIGGMLFSSLLISESLISSPRFSFPYYYDISSGSPEYTCSSDGITFTKSFERGIVYVKAVFGKNKKIG